MITKRTGKDAQVEMVSIEQLVPADHLLRKIDEYIDFSFIYELVEEKYSPDNGRPSIDPVTLIKIPIIQYLFGIRSMRQTIKELKLIWHTVGFWGLVFMTMCLISALSARTTNADLKEVTSLKKYSRRYSFSV